MSINLTWEEAILWLQQQPDQYELVKDCYYDDPLINTAKRFSLSEEWRETTRYLPKKPGKALDLGAGRGISSYALAKLGWLVTALEPDRGIVAGAGAIRSLASESDLPIHVVEDWGEKLPFENNSFDLVYCRQVLHHASNLTSFSEEAFRVLKPGGRFIAVREHVISQSEDLQRFLNTHPLNHMYGGENAFMLQQYIESLRGSGLRLIKVLGSCDSVINYYPLSYENWVKTCSSPLKKIFGTRISSVVIRIPFVGQWLMGLLAHYRSKMDNTPGRLYSFICEKS